MGKKSGSGRRRHGGDLVEGKIATHITKVCREEPDAENFCQILCVTLQRMGHGKDLKSKQVSGKVTS